MNAVLPLILPVVLVLSGCKVLQAPPMPAPPATEKATEIHHNQTGQLEKIGSLSATVRGSPDDVERAIQQKAQLSGARYYVIDQKSDATLSGTWYAHAVLYR